MSKVWMPPLIKITDPDVIYVRLTKKKVKKTLEFGPGVFVDVDNKGYPIGYEFTQALNVSVQPEIK